MYTLNASFPYIYNRQTEGSDTWLPQTSLQHILQQLESDCFRREPSVQEPQYSDLKRVQEGFEKHDTVVNQVGL